MTRRGSNPLNNAYQGLLTRCQKNHDPSLELWGDTVDDDILAQLFRHKHLKELHIVAARSVTDAGLTYIENLRNLEWLNLDGVAITDKGLQFLQHMTRLRGLHLTGAFLTGCGLEHLVALKTLEYLDLDGTNVNDGSMQILGRLKCLKTLRLNDTAVTDKGIRKLQKLRKLRTLFLYRSHVSAECVETLRKHMPKCEIRWSAYVSPKSIPVKLPKLFSREELKDQDPGWHLKLVADTSKIKIEMSKWYTPKPDLVLKHTGFKPSQPSWFHLLDWKDEQNENK